MILKGFSNLIRYSVVVYCTMIRIMAKSRIKVIFLIFAIVFFVVVGLLLLYNYLTLSKIRVQAGLEEDIKKKSLVDVQSEVIRRIGEISVKEAEYYYKRLSRDLMVKLHWHFFNNIEIRNNALLAVLSKKLGKDPSVYQERLKQCLRKQWDGDSWAEGPTYYLYAKSALIVYLQFFDDLQINSIVEKADDWLASISMLDGEIPAIGDSLWKMKLPKGHPKADTYFGCNETVFKTPKYGLLVNHRRNLGENALNTHMHFDLMNIVLYKDGQYRILPVGYPGAVTKHKYKLQDRKYGNIMERTNFPILEWQIYKSFYFSPWRYLACLFNWGVQVIRRDSNYISMKAKYLGATFYRTVELYPDSIKVIDSCNKDFTIYWNLSPEVLIEINGAKKIERKQGLHSPSWEIVETHPLYVVYGKGGQKIETEIILQKNKVLLGQ